MKRGVEVSEKLIIDYVDSDNFIFKLGEKNTSKKVIFAEKEDYREALFKIKLVSKEDTINVDVYSMEIENGWLVINDWIIIKNDNMDEIEELIKKINENVGVE